MADFAKNFWPPEATNRSQFDIVARKCDDGLSTLKKFRQVLVKQSKAEEKYSRDMDLLQYETLAEGEQSRNNLRQFSSLMADVFNGALTKHAELSKMIKRMDNAITHYDTHRKTNHETFIQLHRYMVSLREQIDRSKAKYVSTHDKLNYAHQNLNQIDPQSEKVAKYREKVSDASAEFQHAKTQYQVSVDKYNAALDKNFRPIYSQIMESFQRLEENRLEVLRDEMWTYANIFSDHYIRCSASAEELRVRLEKSQLDEDIAQFSRASKMQKFPVHIHFESVEHN